MTKVRLLIILLTIISVGLLLMTNVILHHFGLQSINKDFLFNLITEILGIGITVLIVEIFANRLISKVEIKDYINIHEYNLKRLQFISIRIRQSLILMCIDFKANINTLDSFDKIIDLTKLKELEERLIFTNYQEQSIKRQKPFWFYSDTTVIFNELINLSNGFPKHTPIKLYESVIKITNHDSYIWSNLLTIPTQDYNIGWLNSIKKELFDYYYGYKMLCEGIEELNEIIKKNK
jgi:hypothetical protein